MAISSRFGVRWIIGAGLVAFMGVSAAAAQSVSPSTWKAPRTPDGQPDLQGVWEHNAVTPLERSSQLANKPMLTDAESR
jgi:hypothetical protein